MGRRGITFSDVKEAVSLIQDRGQRVTFERVRAITGGSNSTIMPFLNALNQGLGSVKDTARDPLEESLMDSVRALYVRIEAKASIDLEHARELHALRIKEITDHLERVTAKYSQSTHSLEEISDELEKLRTSLVEAQSLAQVRLGEINTLRLEAKARAQDLLDRAAEMRELRKQIEIGRQRFEHFSTEADKKMQKELTAKEERIARLEADLNTIRIDHLGVIEQRAQFETALNSERAAHCALRQEAMDVRVSEQAAQRALTLSKATSQHLEERLAEERTEHTSTREQVAALGQEVQTLRIDLATRQSQVAQLRQRLASAESRLNRLVSLRRITGVKEEQESNPPGADIGSAVK
jgi:chromosome segregation ATPase